MNSFFFQELSNSCMVVSLYPSILQVKGQLSLCYPHNFNFLSPFLPFRCHTSFKLKFQNIYIHRYFTLYIYAPGNIYTLSYTFLICWWYLQTLIHSPSFCIAFSRLVPVKIYSLFFIYLKQFTWRNVKVLICIN